MTEDLITEIHKLETFDDYITAINITLLECSGKLNTTDNYDDNGGVVSLIQIALDSCEALFAASRIKGKDLQMVSRPEQFSPRTKIDANKLSYQRNPQEIPKVIYEAGNELFLHCEMLYVYASFTSAIKEFIDNPKHFVYWPRNPHASVFMDSGLSWLEAAFEFTKKHAENVALLLNPLIDEYLIKNPHMKNRVRELPITPKPEPFIKSWQERVVQYFRKTISINDISNVEMEKGFNSIRSNIEHEFNEHLKVCGWYPTREPKGKEQSKNADREAQLFKPNSSEDSLNNNPVTLTQFLITRCGYKQKKTIKTAKDAIRKAADAGNITLPEPLNKPIKGQSFKYSGSKLAKLWPDYQLAISNLRPLSAEISAEK